MILIETKRLILREFQIEDTLPLNDICNESYILKWMPDWESTVQQRKRWIQWVSSKYNEITKCEMRVMLALTEKNSGNLMGMVGLGNKREVNNEIEIAYFISSKYSKNGFTTEAANAIANWAFESIGLEYLIAIVEPDNYASQKVLEKCEFKKQETKMILNSGETEVKPFYYYRLYNPILSFV